MSKFEPRYMHLLCFFDLPVVTARQRKIANNFRRFLKRDGYTRLQWSVYDRLCNGEDSVEKHVSRLIKLLPRQGNVRLLQITDRQFARMRLLLGEKTATERKNYGAAQLLLF